MIVSFNDIKKLLDEKSILMKEVYEAELLKEYSALIPLLQDKFNTKEVYNFLSYTNYNVDISFIITAYKISENVFSINDNVSKDSYELYFSSENGIKINNKILNNCENMILVIDS
ncbi:hypothetical protein [Brachyspira hampsonii]|uniref:Uncharacterized protein n=1 Tax=Brachyspira hampsonii TaxID=1287055 RepID=A0AAC9TTY8_9SPIR|nr:hypothetical protein [Brachyspira hampsonii]ASJ21873.1 hypothetical protein BHAMNSH16_09565 [Brachyspira hampsonii]ELV06067.1 hypothetical protein H263_06482 [Brachyspira hampsonii 30599]MBW5381045.1 hypothetical protein [Brachyspira hampsonii]MBW5410232.1 hypothetical protein [Brachyspira hampsonii]OEJ17251.1 hypothetical protein A9496_11635 [Brachyspira hampsonii]